MRSFRHWNPTISWTTSVAAHCGVLGILAGIGAVKTEHTWDTSLARGQSIALAASFATPHEPTPDALWFTSPEPQREVTLQPMPTSIQRVAADLTEKVPDREIPVVIVESSEMELPTPQKISEKAAAVPNATLDEVLAVPPRATAAIDIPTEYAAELPSNASSGVDELPRQGNTNRPPAYPADALRERRDGLVMIRAMVAADGHISKAEIETSSGAASLDAAALAAVVQWHFTPARRNGVAIDYEILIPVRFRL